MPELPGGPVARRPLHFIFILDVSGSMTIDGKIQALNQAIREAIPHMVDVAEANPFANVLVRAASFSNGARWVVDTPTPVGQFQWSNLGAEGMTDMGHALRLVADQLRIPPMTERALPPVLVLISDGQPSDDFPGGLAALMAEPWGRRAVRVAIAIGSDADHGPLQQFIGEGSAPLQADNPEALVRLIRWASTAVVQASIAPASQTVGAAPVTGNVPIPQPVPLSGGDDTSVW